MFTQNGIIDVALKGFAVQYEHMLFDASGK